MGRNWNSWATRPFNVYNQEHIKLTRENTARAIEAVITDTFTNIEKLSKDKSNPGLVFVAAKAVIGAADRGEFTTLDRLLDRVIGKASQPIELIKPPSEGHNNVVSFEQFCINAGYPVPYPMQIEMKEFGIDEPGARMLLGSRGYGKTDYVVILGVGYDLYLDYMQSVMEQRPPEQTYLLVTKSDDRNAAILKEVLKACLANGVPFEKESNKALRVSGLMGKDHSIAAITIGSASIRGRHPKKIIMDDPVTEEDVSEATRKRAQSVYNELSKLTNNLLIIGQPVHKFDLYETLRPVEGVRKLEVPHGSIPELDHDIVAQRLAGVSEESIQASYFLKVISEAGNPLENISFIDDFPPGGSAVAFIDPSFEGGDFTAMSVGKAYFDGIVIKGFCWKRAWFNCIDEILEACTELGVERICFETNSLGEHPVVMLREVLDGIGVVGRKSTGHKHSRISAVGPYAKLIHLARTSHRSYIDQTVKYEYGAKKDDGPDSLASLLAWIGLIRGKE